MKKRMHCPYCNSEVFTVEHWNSGTLFYESCPKCKHYIVKHVPDYVEPRPEPPKNFMNIPSPLYEILVGLVSIPVIAVILLIIEYLVKAL